MSGQRTLPALPQQDGVRFAHIPGHPGYCAGDDGSIWSCRPPNGAGPFVGWRRKQPTGRPRLHVVLFQNGRSSTFSVYRLILLAFVGPCPEGKECAHENGNMGDNRLCNLAWKTKAENARDKHRHGTTARGSRQGLAKLTEADIPAIRQMLQDGVPKLRIAKRYGVHHSAIHWIAKGKTWRHVP